jgi:hypothetical protein
MHPEDDGIKPSKLWEKLASLESVQRLSINRPSRKILQKDDVQQGKLPQKNDLKSELMSKENDKCGFKVFV